MIIGSIAAAFVANDGGEPVLSIRAEFVSTIGVEFVGIVTAIGRGSFVSTVDAAGLGSIVTV